MKPLFDAAVILATAAVLSVLNWYAQPGILQSLSAQHSVSVGQAVAMDGAIWLDARTRAEFEDGSYMGALLLNEEDWEGGFMNLLELWVPDTPIVVFCGSRSCMRSHEVAERLRAELGSTTVFAIEGGWEAMIEADLVEDRP